MSACASNQQLHARQRVEGLSGGAAEISDVADDLAATGLQETFDALAETRDVGAS